MAQLIPCWVVNVRHERNSGKLGHFLSKPLTLTDARQLLCEYEATGHQVSIVCIEELAAIHRRMIRGELDYDEALVLAEDAGYHLG